MKTLMWASRTGGAVAWGLVAAGSIGTTAAADICSDQLSCSGPPGSTALRLWTVGQAGTNAPVSCSTCHGPSGPGVADSFCKSTTPQAHATGTGRCGYPAPVHLHVSASAASFAGLPDQQAGGGAGHAGVSTQWVFCKPGMSGPLSWRLHYRVTVVNSSPSHGGVYLRIMGSNCGAPAGNTTGIHDHVLDISSITDWGVPKSYTASISTSTFADGACDCARSVDVRYELTNIEVFAPGGVPVTGFQVRDVTTGHVVFGCASDINCSGSITVQDIFDFLAAYFGNDPRADFNASGTISVQDIFDFLAAYFAGCN